MPCIQLSLVPLGLLALCACAPGAHSQTPPMQDEPEARDVLYEYKVDAVLTDARTTVTVPFPEAVTSETAGGRLGLYLEEVVFEQRGVAFEVYVNLPPDTEPDPSRVHYLGNLAHFGPADEKVHAGFEITDLARRLQSAGAWGEEMKLTFVPMGLEGAPSASGQEVVARFTSVHLLRE